MFTAKKGTRAVDFKVLDIITDSDDSDDDYCLVDDSTAFFCDDEPLKVPPCLASPSSLWPGPGHTPSPPTPQHRRTRLA